LADASDNGDGSYSITMPVAIPDGSQSPGVAASGSGVATVEGHPIIELDANNDGEDEPTSVSVGDATSFFSIDEADGEPDDRRVSVKIEQCNSCHSSLVLHGSNRADNIDSCVSCHNPRNTDLRRREGSSSPPEDGKKEESVDFKTMVHAIHAAGIRENPLQVYGFGSQPHVYSTEEVHYPGNLANCTACHTEEGFRLPLASGVLATTNDTGDDVQDPADDTVTTPISAVCSSCHDYAKDISHMEFYDGNFSTTQEAIDDRTVVEQCDTCHATGKPDDAWEVHQRFLD
jgi:OmcA/MtrC family decaheme c-type cytochrome